MSGLDTLMTDGLVITADTLAERAAVFGIAELLEWHSMGGGNLPDADMTVLMWVEESDGATNWYAGGGTAKSGTTPATAAWCSAR